jgi:NAD(P)H-binding
MRETITHPRLPDKFFDGETHALPALQIFWPKKAIVSMIATMSFRNIFVTGGTGYIGSRLIPLLLQRGHHVRALVREGSESKLSPGCTAVIGNALDKTTFVDRIQPADTFVQLMIPVYWLMERLPGTRESARRLGLVTIHQMLATLLGAVENPAVGIRIMEVAQIRAADLKQFKPTVDKITP